MEISIIKETFQPFTLVLDFKTQQDVEDFNDILKSASEEGVENEVMLNTISNNVAPYLDKKPTNKTSHK